MQGYRKEVLSGQSQIKPYMNEITSEEKEKRRVEGDQADDWFKSLEQKAQEFYDKQGLSFKQADQYYASNYDRMRTKMYEQVSVPQAQAQDTQVRVQHSSMVEPQHMNHYNGFLRLWKQYQVDTEHGPQYYWHNEKLSKSTWESPVMIWKALQDASIPNTRQNMPVEWDILEGTPFLKIKVKGQAGVKKFYFLHKPTMRLFKQNPFVKKTQEQEIKEESEQNPISSEGQEEFEAPVSSSLTQRKASSRIITLKDFQEEYSEFCQMLKSCKIDPLSTYDRELPKFISDQRVSLIPKQLRREAFEKYCRDNEAEAIQSKESSKEKASKEFSDWLGIILSTQEELLDFEEFQIQFRKQPQFLNAVYELTSNDLKVIYLSEANKEKKKRKSFQREVFQAYVREHYNGEESYEAFKAHQQSTEQIGGISEKERAKIYESEVKSIKKELKKAIEQREQLKEKKHKLEFESKAKKEESALLQLYETLFENQIIAWESGLTRLKANASYKDIELPLEKKKIVFEEFQKDTYFKLQKNLEALIEEKTTPRTTYQQFESESFSDPRFKSFPSNDSPYVFQRFQELRGIEWTTQLESLIDQVVAKEGKTISSIPRFHELMAEDNRYARFPAKDSLWRNQMVLQYAEKKYADVLPFLAD